MSNAEQMQAAIMQVAIQAVTVPVRVMRKANPPAKPHTRRNTQEEHHKPRQARPMMNQPAFNW